MSIVVMSGASKISKYNNNRIRERRRNRALLLGEKLEKRGGRKETEVGRMERMKERRRQKSKKVRIEEGKI